MNKVTKFEEQNIQRELVVIVSTFYNFLEKRMFLYTNAAGKIYFYELQMHVTSERTGKVLRWTIHTTDELRNSGHKS